MLTLTRKTNEQVLCTLSSLKGSHNDSYKDLSGAILPFYGRYSNPAMLKNWTCEYWLNSLAWVVPNVIFKQTI